MHLLEPIGAFLQTWPHSVSFEVCSEQEHKECDCEGMSWRFIDFSSTIVDAQNISVVRLFPAEFSYVLSQLYGMWPHDYLMSHHHSGAFMAAFGLEITLHCSGILLEVINYFMSFIFEYMYSLRIIEGKEGFGVAKL